MEEEANRYPDAFEDAFRLPALAASRDRFFGRNALRFLNPDAYLDRCTAYGPRALSHKTVERLRELAKKAHWRPPRKKLKEPRASEPRVGRLSDSHTPARRPRLRLGGGRRRPEEPPALALGHAPTR